MLCILSFFTPHQPWNWGAVTWISACEVTEELEVVYHSTALLSWYGDRKEANRSVACERRAWHGRRISRCHLQPIPNSALRRHGGCTAELTGLQWVYSRSFASSSQQTIVAVFVLWVPEGTGHFKALKRTALRVPQRLHCNLSKSCFWGTSSKTGLCFDSWIITFQ